MHAVLFSFQLNQTSGEIKTAVALDRETDDSHIFTVIATDQGHPKSLSSQVQVRVLVEDINDNPPVFAKNEYSLSLSLYTEPGLFLTVNVRCLSYIFTLLVRKILRWSAKTRILFRD